MVRASSENAGNKKFAGNAIDGDPATHWHTRFSGTTAPPPHELVIDLGSNRNILGFVYLGRQDGGWNGAVKDIEFSISDTAEEFGPPVAKATLRKTKEPQTIRCDEHVGRYVRLRALNEYSSGNSFATVAELGILGK
mgnify:FL=1